MSDELSELEKQIAELTRKKEKIKSERKAEVIEEVKKLVSQYDITAADLGLSFSAASSMTARKSSRAGSTVAIKYRDGENTWTGRGRMPLWVKQKQENGEDIKDYEVN